MSRPTHLPEDTLRLNEITADHMVWMGMKEGAPAFVWAWEDGQIVFRDEKGKEIEGLRVQKPELIDEEAVRTMLEKAHFILVRGQVTNMPYAIPPVALTKAMEAIARGFASAGKTTTRWEQKEGMFRILDNRGRLLESFHAWGKDAITYRFNEIRQANPGLPAEVAATELCTAMHANGIQLNWRYNARKRIEFYDTGGKTVEVTPENRNVPIVQDYSRRLNSMGGTIADGPVIIHADDARISIEQWKDAFESIAKRREGRKASFWKFLAEQVQHAQTFEFGEVADERIQKEAPRAAGLLEKGLLSLPFKCVVYWYNVEMYDPNEGKRVSRRMATIASRDVPGESTDGRKWFFAVDFLRMGQSDYPTPEGKFTYLLEGAIALTPNGETKQWTGNVIERAHNLDQEEKDNQMFVSVADGMASLSLMLATKGIPLRTEHPSPKLQKKRAERKRYPLPIVTHVDARFYHEAASRTDRGGTHSSPVPHLRRGHQRVYKDERYRNVPINPETGRRERWIEDMLVNCRSAEEITDQRQRYEVKTKP